MLTSETRSFRVRFWFLQRKHVPRRVSWVSRAEAGSGLTIEISQWPFFQKEFIFTLKIFLMTSFKSFTPKCYRWCPGLYHSTWWPLLRFLNSARPLLQPRAPGQYTTWPPLICHGEFDYHFTLMGEYDIKCKFFVYVDETYRMWDTVRRPS